MQVSVNDDYVSATARVSAINGAFSVQMRRYEVTSPEGKQTTIESNDRELTVPASVSSDILAITGLNTARYEADDATRGTSAGGATSTTPTSSGTGAKAPGCSKYWAQRTTTISPEFEGLTQAAIPVCGYSAKQVRAAYGLTSADTGAGKTIALIQVGAPDKMFQALTDYAKVNGLRVPRSKQFREESVGRGGHHAGASTRQPLRRRSIPRPRTRWPPAPTS